MARFRILCMALAALFIAAAPAASQEDGQLLLVEYFDVAPEDFTAFEDAAQAFVEAARAADLPPGQGWWIWQDGFVFAVVQPIPSMALLDDPMWFADRFSGTAGEARLNTAFERLMAVDFTMTTEVLRMDPSLSFTPEGAADARFAHIAEEWVRPSRGEDYHQLLQSMMPMLETMGYPFQLQTYTTVVGPSRYVFVALFDDPGAYYSMEAQMMASPEAAQMIEQWAPLIQKFEESRMRYRPELSWEGGM